MSSTTNRRLPPTGGRTPTQKHQMATFARKLHEIMTQKDMSGADLARRVFGEKVNKKTGYTEADGRDRISSYLHGKVFPEARTIRKIAEALNVPMEELAPDATAAAVDREHLAFSMNTAVGHPGMTHLIVNMLVPMTLAAQIGGLLAAYEEQKSRENHA
jgi:transcriptional regulator with XRE-family HTH domain